MEQSKMYRSEWGKCFGVLLLSVTIVFASLLAYSSVGACPYDADIILNGSEYSAISAIRNSEPEGWVIDNDVIYTFWEDEWVEYTAYLTEGIWKIGICAINYSHPGHDGLGSDPSWYPQFELSNSLTDDIVIVPASDTVLNSGYFCYEVPSDGSYTVRFTWLNDKAWGERPDGVPILDANIKIVRVFFEEGICTIMVDIDIKPGSDPNPINQGSNGLIPVAIFSSPEFDATTVDPATVELGGAGVAVRGKADKSMAHAEDVNGDGLVDLVVQVETSAAGVWTTGDVILTGQTFDGQSIEGSDVVVIVPPE